MANNYGVWLSSCPRRSRRRAAAMLTPHVGIVRAEKEVADAGGRCVALFGTLDEAEGVASGLRDIGCAASAAEVADWP